MVDRSKVLAVGLDQRRRTDSLGDFVGLNIPYRLDEDGIYDLISVDLDRKRVSVDSLGPPVEYYPILSGVISNLDDDWGFTGSNILDLSAGFDSKYESRELGALYEGLSGGAILYSSELSSHQRDVINHFFGRDVFSEDFDELELTNFRRK